MLTKATENYPDYAPAHSMFGVQPAAAPDTAWPLYWNPPLVYPAFVAYNLSAFFDGILNAARL
jgi:hypothetical protein